MEKKYWERIATSYETEIFDVLQNDTSKKILKAIRSFASKEKNIIDIGCAVGKWIPVLAPNFKEVHAIDISSKNLKIAAAKYPHFKNVKYDCIDMSAKTIKYKQFDSAICINAILSSSLKKRDLFFSHINKLIKKGGDLILVIPSLESKLLSHIIAQKWNVDDIKNEKSPNGKLAISQMEFMKNGVTDIDQVPTKHYLKEELELILELSGFVVEKIEKINYTWDTEFHQAPAWLKNPQPWDWMVKAKKG